MTNVTNQEILNYLERILGEIAKAMSTDLKGLTEAQIDLAAEVHQASRLSLENKGRLDNLEKETPIALLKDAVSRQGTNWGTVSNIVIGVIQAILVAVLLTKFM